jgi:class 3 adenylate cyclase/tetratricopeptide (TPR) repeat protein
MLNPPGMRFCGQCGGSLGLNCPACGSLSPPGFRFCGQCGNPLVAASHLSPPAKARLAVGKAEHRQITVLFCDLVGSTRLSDQLESEELRTLLLSYHTAAGSVVEHYQGTIAQYLGDGLLIYFGYPAAQDDDAQRAVTTGLEILEAIRQLNDQYRAKDIDVQARIGIHTGLGVAGEVGTATGKREQLVIGKTPNVAARLQDLADCNTILISDATWKLVADYFVCESQGPVSLKGIGDSIKAHKVLRPTEVQGRFQASVRRGLAPIFGREEEMQLLLDRFNLALTGLGQTVFMQAEAGIGKSRFVHEFQTQCRGRALILSGGCTSTGQNAAFLPVIEAFRQFLSIDPADSDDTARHKIDHFLGQAGEATPDNRSLVCALLEVPSDQPPLSLPAPKQRELTIHLLVRLLMQAAMRRPVLVVLEDLHWVDPSTLEFVHGLLEEATQARLLLLLTSRPEFVPPWSARPSLTSLPLQRLGKEDIERVVLALTGKPIPESVMEQLIEKSDGVPLFVEELTRSVLESGVLEETATRWQLVRPLNSSSIPTTLRDSLMGRLDRLGPAKDVAQTASAIGRFFSYKLIATICHAFKHVLIQDTAYESMLRSRRREIHGALARTMEADFPEIVQTRPELLALHYFEAGFVEASVAYRLKAGQRLMQSGAYSEAIAELNHGIHGLKALPASASHHSQEVELRVALGGCLVATRGYCAQEVEENVQRSRDLCALLHNPSSQVIPALYGLWVVNLASSRVEPTMDYARQLAEYLTPDEEPRLKVTIHFANGTTLLYLGRFDEARREFHRAISFYAPSMHARMVSTFGDDHGQFSTIYLQWLEGLTGHVDRALELVQSTLESAEILEDPLSMALALSFAMIAYHDLRQPLKAAEFAARNVELCSQQGFVFWGALSKIGLGWALATTGAGESSLPMIKSGLAFFDIIQQKLPLAYWKSYLVEAHLHDGNWQGGLEAVEEALALSSTNLDRFYHPELLRLKGDLLQLREPGGKACRALYREAVAHSRGSGSALLELRAAVSLARVLGRRSKEGRAALQQALAKFPDGFDARDYHEAVSLQAEFG